MVISPRRFWPLLEMISERFSKSMVLLQIRILVSHSRTFNEWKTERVAYLTLPSKVGIPHVA